MTTPATAPTPPSTGNDAPAPVATPPSVGRVVHYVLPKPPADPKKDPRETAGEHRAAIITNVESSNATTCNLAVFRGALNDFATGDGRIASHDPDRATVAFLPEVSYDAEGQKPHTWHWPEKL